MTTAALTDADLERLRSCLGRELSIEDVRALVMRLNLDGWRLVSASHLETELARALRLATRCLASEMQSIAARFDALSDVELLIGHSPHLRRWLQSSPSEGEST